MRHTASFSFRSDRAGEIFRALAPERGEINPRTKARVTLEQGDILVVSIAAGDIPALRAALNMWLRLVSVAGEMLEMAQAKGKEQEGFG
ncbi:MAG: KEOPS complex subunit Pcc1 [Methanomicrobiales archaeon]